MKYSLTFGNLYPKEIVKLVFEYFASFFGVHNRQPFGFWFGAIGGYRFYKVAVLQA